MSMFNKLRELRRLGGSRSDHPLAAPRELRRAIDEIPRDDAFKAVDEILGWLESLQGASDLPPARLADALAQLDDAAQPHLRRLARNYLQAPRLSRAEEQRLRGLSAGCWDLLAAGYERCLASGTGFDAALVADLSVRLLIALGQVLKWQRFHYAPPDGELWKRLGAALQAAENARAAERLVSLPGMPGGPTSARREFTRRVAFEAATLDSLLPLQIELAERLIGHVLPAFVLADRSEHDSVYWVDLGAPMPPKRMADMPDRAAAGQRFFKPAAAHGVLTALLHELERGRDVPADINLGGQYQAQVLVPVLRHLALYLAPVPPQRRHPRHEVRQRASVVSGMAAVSAVLGSLEGARPAMAQAESWVVENVSRGGFGAVVTAKPGEWLRVGALLALQPEGGSNWLVGVVRRCQIPAGGAARVGIETLARRPQPFELRALTSSSYVAVDGIPALLIREDCQPGEWRALLPNGSFALRDDMECFVEGHRVVLHPVALVEAGADWELARFRPVGAP
jgi:hypothetical protein